MTLATNGHSRFNGHADPKIPRGELPPQNVAMEAAVIGGILQDPETLHAVSLEVGVNDFYRDTHQIVFAALLGMFNARKPIDLETLAEELNRTAELEKIGGSLAIVDLVHSAPHAASVVYHAQIIHQKAVLRRLEEAAYALIRDVRSDTMMADDVATKAQEAIFAASKGNSSIKVYTSAEVIAEADRRIARREDGELPGVPTGFLDLDGKLNGCMGEAELIIIGGRPGSGKTSLALGILERAAVNLLTPTLMISLEMGRGSLGERMLAGRAKVEGKLLRHPWQMTNEHHEQMAKAHIDIAGKPFKIVEQGKLSITQIAALARREKKTVGLGLLIVDYLQLVKGSGEYGRNAARQEVVADVCAGLKDIAKELSIPVLALAQLNRLAEMRANKVPGLGDLRESGAIENDADVVMLAHRPEYYDKDDRPGEAEIYIAKHRDGETGKVDLVFLKDFSRFEDAAPKDNAAATTPPPRQNGYQKANGHAPKNGAPY